jgi:hypothetical protein
MLGFKFCIFDQDNYTNWANGHQSGALFDSGLKTVGEVNTALSKAGTYFVVFSNKHAILFYQNGQRGSEIGLRQAGWLTVTA